MHAYNDILRNAGPSFRTILLHLANLPPPHPTAPPGALIHCTAGKDRTGIFFGLLLSFLGVAPETIAAEYNLTEQGLADIREDVVRRLMLSIGFKKCMAAQGSVSPERLEELVTSHGVGTEASLGDEERRVLELGRRGALRMVGASRETMVRSLEMVDKEFGGAEKYMREYCGLGDEELEGLRRNLVVGDGA